MTTLSATKLVFGIVLAIGLVIASIERVEALDYPVKNLRVGEITYESYCLINPNECPPFRTPRYDIATVSVFFDIPDPYGLREDGTIDRTNNGVGRPFDWFIHYFDEEPNRRYDENRSSRPAWRTIRGRESTRELVYVSHFLDEDSPNFVSDLGFDLSITTIPYYYNETSTPEEAELFEQNSVTQTITIRIPYNPNPPSPPEPETPDPETPDPVAPDPETPTTPDPETPTEHDCTYEHRLIGVPGTTGAGFTSQILISSKDTNATATIRAYQSDNGQSIDVLDSEGSAVGYTTSLSPANSVKQFRLEGARGWHTVIVEHPTARAMRRATVAMRLREPDTGVSIILAERIEDCEPVATTTE